MGEHRVSLSGLSHLSSTLMSVFSSSNTKALGVSILVPKSYELFNATFK